MGSFGTCMHVNIFFYLSKKKNVSSKYSPVESTSSHDGGVVRTTRVRTRIKCKFVSQNTRKIVMRISGKNMRNSSLVDLAQGNWRLLAIFTWRTRKNIIYFVIHTLTQMRMGCH